MPDGYAIMADVHRPPDDLAAQARRYEELGFAEVWFAEDCFLVGGIAAVATALAATERIGVGVGILPAVARNPAMVAMEAATLARLHPGRSLLGLGHGVPAWMRQIGAEPASALGALEEHAVAVRSLLHGEEVTVDGDFVRLDAVRLAFPPEPPPPLYLGVRGPRSLALSGRVADGTVLADWAGPGYVAWARERIAHGAGGAAPGHRLAVSVITAVDDDAERALDVLRPQLARQLARADLRAQFAPLADRHDLAADVPSDHLIRAVAVAGGAEGLARGLAAFRAAGADRILVNPRPHTPEHVERIAAALADAAAR